MMNLVLFGPPGAGKGTQSEKIIKKYGLTHISTGNLFRQHIKQDTALGRLVKETINNGQFASDELTILVVKEEIDKHPDAKGFLFDGFPRTVAQAEALDTLVHSPKVIALDVDEDVVRRRIAKRKDIEHRMDDEEDKLNRRLEEYFSKTVHVFGFYKKSGRLSVVDGMGYIDEVFDNICKEINS